MRAIVILTPVTLLTLSPVPRSAPELPPPMRDTEVASILDQAPELPIQLDLGLATRLTDFNDVPKTLPRSRGHQRNFLDCIKTRRPTDSNLDYALRLNAPMLLSIVSYRLRRPLRFDPEAERFIGDDEANRLLGRVYREPWVLPA